MMRALLRWALCMLVAVQICFTIAFIAAVFFFALQGMNARAAGAFRMLAIVHFGSTLGLQLACLVSLWRSSDSVARKCVWTAGIVLVGFLAAPAYFFYRELRSGS